MTTRGRKVGGILSIIGGGLFSFWIVMSLITAIEMGSMALADLSALILFLVWTVFGVVGGILLWRKDNGLGGLFPILAGLSFILFMFVMTVSTNNR